MKRLIHIITIVIIAIASLLAAIIIFLFIFYEVRDYKLSKAKADLSANHRITTIDADTIATSGTGTSLLLLPVPQKVTLTGGFYSMPGDLTFSTIDSVKEDIAGIILRAGMVTNYVPRKADLVISGRNDLHTQGYNLQITQDGIILEYGDPQGLYYGLITLKVLNHNYGGKVPCVVIEDYPDLPVRGLMLDISRDKVPTPATLKNLVSLIADLKYNHLELYIEGFSFAYPSFADLWQDKETPVTGLEIRSLDSLCRAHFIELVPNQNSLGHMMAWLATDKYSNLAECPKGYKLMGLINMKGTMDPTNPGSLELVTRMTDDLLPWFTSDKFNVNLDEPFELGLGKSKREARKKGVAGLYLDYARKLQKIVTQRNKKMLMWGDVTMRHPEMLKKLPSDITLLDWGYEASYPFERNCKMLELSGISYMVCPGTSSWTSIAGRTDNMLANISSAAINGARYGATGLILTDWGDMGHWQYLPVSYAGYATGGALSWNSKSSGDLPLASFLNGFIFRDQRQIMADLVMDLGRYKQFEEVTIPNMTTTMLALQFGLNDRLMVDAIYNKISEGIVELMKDLSPEMIQEYKANTSIRQPFDYSGMYTFLNEKEALLNLTNLQTPDSTVITDEYKNAIRLIRIGTELQQYIEDRSEMNSKEQITLLTSVNTGLNVYLKENHRLWLLRNKPGGYERSVTALNKLQTQIDERVELLNKSWVSRLFGRFMEKIKTAAAVIYISLA